MKKGSIIFLIVILILIVITITYIFKDTVQLAPSDKTNVRVSVGNANPKITNLDAILPVILSPAPDSTTVSFTFTARDPNGASDLNDATATASFTKTGEATRTDPNCAFLSEAGKSRTYQCQVNMLHFDSDGIDWNVAVSIEDTQAAQATDNAAFTVNPLKDIAITPPQIDFPTVIPEQTDVLPTGGQITSVRNRGNYEGTIQVISSDLIGETTPTENIPATNFRVSGSSQAISVCTTGTPLISASPEIITSTALPRGADDGSSNIEELSYCLTLVPDLSSQFYSSTVAGGNAWTIQI